MYTERLMITADLVKLINADIDYKPVQQKVIKEKIEKVYSFLKSEIELGNIKLDDQQRKIYDLYIKNIEQKKFKMYTGVIYLTLLSLYEDECFFKLLKYKPIDNMDCEVLLHKSNDKMRIWLNLILDMYYKEYVNTNRKNRKKSLNFKVWKQNWYEEHEEEAFNLIVYFNGIIFKLWEANKKRLSNFISNEANMISDIMEKVAELPDVRKYSLLQKLNKNLHEWFQQEIRKLKYELTKAICDYNEEEILEIKTQLSFCYTTIQSKIGTEEEEVFFEYVRDTLIKYSYPIIAIETYMVDFKSAYFILNHKQKKVIEKGFKKLSQYSNSRNIMLFIEEVINNYNKQKERNNDLAMQGYKQWRDKCLLAFKRRKFDVLLELLQARDEYVYMKSNDVKIYKKTNELFDQLIKCKDEKVLKIIFNIYGIYKVSFMKKSI